MNDNNHNYDLIDRYFEGDLNSKELCDFQSKLTKDKDFAKAFDLEQNLIHGMEAFGNQDLKATLQKIHQEEVVSKQTTSSTTKIVQMRTFHWLALAASFALLAVIGIWWMQNSSSSQDLFVAHYQRPAFETLRGNQVEDLKAIQTFYKDRKFQETIIAIHEYLENHPENESVRLSLGISQLEVGQLKEAIQTFKSLTKSDELDDQATWYLALTYLKNGQADLAKTALQSLVDGTVLSTKKRQSEAAEVLEDL